MVNVCESPHAPAFTLASVLVISSQQVGTLTSADSKVIFLQTRAKWAYLKPRQTCLLHIQRKYTQCLLTKDKLSSSSKELAQMLLFHVHWYRGNWWVAKGHHLNMNVPLDFSSPRVLCLPPLIGSVLCLGGQGSGGSHAVWDWPLLSELVRIRAWALVAQTA